MILTKDPQRFANKIAAQVIKFSNLKYFVEALKEMHPNRWDYGAENLERYYDYKVESNILTMMKKNVFSPYFIIHYPEITITNGRDKRVLYDLYVKIFFSINSYNKNTKFIATRIEGMRASRTLEELESKYIHSHLPSSRSNFFSVFCLGSGPINKFLFTPFNTVEEFKHFLIILKSYLEWESISGIPYIQMSSVGSYSTPNVSKSYAKELVKGFLFKDINFKITPYNIEVVFDENLENKIFKVLKEVGSKHLCYKNTEGKYISDTKIIVQKSYGYLQDETLFTFRGKEVKFKIINKEENNNYEYNAPNPKLTEQVCRVLSEELTKKHIIGSRIAKENKVEDTQEGSESNTILVSSDT